jgi:hypothetical protein
MTTAGSFDGPRSRADGRPCRDVCANDSCGRCRASWDTLSARNSCERMSETLLLCYFRLRGVLRTSVQSETDPNAAQLVARAWEIGRSSKRLSTAWMNCKAHAQASRHSLVSQSQGSVAEARDQHDQHLLRKNTNIRLSLLYQIAHSVSNVFHTLLRTHARCAIRSH